MVGALVYRQDGRCLVLKRAADKDFAAGVWECVTGRVDQGESFTQALQREVCEELGVEIEAEFILGTAHFYRGSEKPENEMLGLFYMCSVQHPESIHTGIEHSEYRWINVEEAEELFEDGYWLLTAIHRAEVLRRELTGELLTLFLEEGFEI